MRVIDVSTLFAGPLCATLLADLGADVIKVEHPDGDSQRKMGWQVEGTSIIWTVTNRNKRSITLDLHQTEGQSLFRMLASNADIVIENFRPGRLEKWGCGYEELSRENPGLILLSVTAFGQTGPWANRPGFGTIAEAMSGFAHINGQPDGPPTLPPFALADSITGVFGATAALSALHRRDSDPEKLGQSIDLSIFEPFFWVLGPQISVFDQLGVIQSRTGNRTPFSSPRNLYQSSDEKWIAISGSAQSIAERLMKMIGADEYIEREWFRDHTGRIEHQDELDDVIGRWIGERTCDEVMVAAEAWEVAACPVFDISDIAENEQYLARKAFVRLPDNRGGSVAIQGVIPIFSRTPGEHRFLGAELGEHNVEVYGEIGCSTDEVDRLRENGVI